MVSRRRLRKYLLSSIFFGAITFGGAATASAQEAPANPVEAVAGMVQDEVDKHVNTTVDSAAFINEARTGLAEFGISTPGVGASVTDSVDRAIVNAVPGTTLAPEPAAEPVEEPAVAPAPAEVPPPAPESERAQVSDPNYRWRNDTSSKVLAAKPQADYVLHRVPGSQFDAPRIPDESNFAASRGNSLYGPGTPIYVGDDTMCTLAVAGTDAEGRKVGITAGHCGEVGDEVSSADSWQVGPSGTVAATNGYYDYALVEFGSNAELTRSYNGVNVDELGGGVAQGDTVCKHGVATGSDCAVTWTANEEVHVSQLCAMNGDSGAPVLRDGRLVGFVSGGSIPLPGAQHLSCRTPLQGPLHAPTTSIDMDAVLGDLERRGGLGAGFTLPEARPVDDNSGR